ncbi:MAG: aspartate kinase, partial [Alphaproteobacteria bacterium]|nr:aspartate kinase [Alphaproteobacteria bacterium]
MSNRQKAAGSRPLLVMKFGGTSVGDMARIKASALWVKHFYDSGYGVVVVVSAMAGETNRLVQLVTNVDPQHQQLHVTAEYDAVVAAGENISAGLMALMLNQLGVTARSWQGWQLPIKTDQHHGQARIIDIETEDLQQSIDSGVVA